MYVSQIVEAKDHTEALAVFYEISVEELMQDMQDYHPPLEGPPDNENIKYLYVHNCEDASITIIQKQD